MLFMREMGRKISNFTWDNLYFHSIPLPPWVLEEISKNPDLVYTDRSGRRNPEYVSLGCDTLPVLRGRTPIQVYADYMRSFRDKFSNYIGSVVAVSIAKILLLEHMKLHQ